MDDVRKWIYGTLIAFVLVVVGFVSFIYISACGFTTSCHSGDLPVERTPIPTLIPATLPVRDVSVKSEAFNKCQVAAVDLIGAWVSSGYPEKDSFQFTDAKGVVCQAKFGRDVQPLFTESNLWYPGSLACASCHQPDLTKAIKNMNLSSYAGIVAGAERTKGEAKGIDILGGGNWEKALLHQMLYAPDGKTLIGKPPMPFGRGADIPANGPMVFAGQPLTSASSESTNPAGTPEATVSEEDIARPSNPGGPGAAVGLKGDAVSGMQIYQANCVTCHADQGLGGDPNPGSTDGTIPALNPIDSTMVSPDYNTFAANIDLFVEHGSTPEGTDPILTMPAWGDKGILTSQQIADVIAYVISLNNGTAPALVAVASPAPAPSTTETAPVPGEIARPSNPGDPGQAINLTGNVDAGLLVYASNCVTCHNAQGVGGEPNPGSTDGTIPELNPIDSTLKSPDYKTFAANLDLFIEHGSTPEGTNPILSMPAWGDKGRLTSQQIADVIAYIISLNK